MVTYRYARLCASVVVVLATVGVGAAQASMLTVDLAASPSSVAVSQPMTVTITANTDEEIAAFGFHLVYDDSLLTLNSVAIASPFQAISVPGAGLANVAGFLPFGAAQGPNPVLLATATFTALTAGQPSVNIGVSPDNKMEGFVAIAANGGTGGGTGDEGVTRIEPTVISPVVLDVTPPGGGAPAPEPVTVLLLAGGLLGLRVRRS